MRKQRIYKWILMVAMLIAGILLGGPAIRAAADNMVTLDFYTPAWEGKVPETRVANVEVTPSTFFPAGCSLSVSFKDSSRISESMTVQDALQNSDTMPDVETYRKILLLYSLLANGVYGGKTLASISDQLKYLSNAYDNTSISTADIENSLNEKVTVYPKSPGHYYVVLPGKPNKYTAKITINQLDDQGGKSEIATTTAKSAYETMPFAISTEDLAEGDKTVINTETGQAVPITDLVGTHDTFPVDMNQGPQTFTIVPQDQLLYATVNYKFADGTEAAPSAKLSGYAGLTTVSAKSPTISGYTPDQKAVAVAFAPTEKTYTVTYKANPTTPTATESSASSSTADEATTFTPFKIYGKRALYTYKNATFKKNQRVSHYAQKAKAYAPIFEVVGTAKSTSGHLRYKLADGTYVTANADYVGALYWQGMYQKLYVTNPKGTNAYDGTSFAQATKQKHYRQGTALTVVKQTQVGQTTRYELTNGTYVTGNKQWVSPTKPRLVKQVKVKRTIRLYRDVNGSTFIKRIKPGKTLTVTGWDYSHGRNPKLSGTLRYQVAGGYITANRQFVVAN